MKAALLSVPSAWKIQDGEVFVKRKSEFFL